MSDLEKPHRGINYNRLPAAGLPGLMLALGVVWMFWCGAPSYRPIAVTAAMIGGIAGALLIVWRARSNRRPDSELLHLREPGDGRSPDMGTKPKTGS